MALAASRPLLVLGFLLASLSSAPAPPPPPPPPPRPPALQAMAEARYKAALSQFEQVWIYYRQARYDIYPVYSWSRLVLDAQFDLSDARADQIAALEAHKERMVKLGALVKKVRRLGFGSAVEVGAVDYYLLDADFMLAEAKAP